MVKRYVHVTQFDGYWIPLHIQIHYFYMAYGCSLIEYLYYATTAVQP